MEKTETPVIFIDKNQVLEDISRTSIQLLLNEPFYGHFFTGLVKSVSEEVDTLAVGYHRNVITLYVNPVFWTQIFNEQAFRYGGIKHEILHIVFKHIFRGKDFSHREICNVAADLVVNQYIAPEQLIEGVVLLSKFPELNLKPFESLNYYYNELIKLYQKNTSGEKEQEESESWKNLRSFLDEFNSNQRKHVFWKKFSELSSAERDMAETLANQSLESVLQRLKPRDMDKLPAGLRQYLEDFRLSQQPSVNWKRVLRLFAASSSRTRIKNTLRRPSKRYHTTPGIQIRKKQKILIAVDTSGSITIEDLREFFSEVHHIWKQGAEVRIVECDTHIHKNYLYKGIPPQEINGGGGTAFEAPILYANEDYHPDALIYFTDGYGNSPAAYSRCPLLWLLCRNGSEAEQLRDFQGRKVKMK